MCIFPAFFCVSIPLGFLRILHVLGLLCDYGGFQTVHIAFYHGMNGLLLQPFLTCRSLFEQMLGSGFQAPWCSPLLLFLLFWPHRTLWQLMRSPPRSPYRPPSGVAHQRPTVCPEGISQSPKIMPRGFDEEVLVLIYLKGVGSLILLVLSFFKCAVADYCVATKSPLNSLMPIRAPGVQSEMVQVFTCTACQGKYGPA